MNALDEFRIAAIYLANLNENATLWDLLVVMYEYRTGHKFPELPSEDDVMNLWFDGLSSRSIARKLNSDLPERELIETVNIIIKSIGFTPHRKDLPCTVDHIFDLLTDGLTVKEVSRLVKVSKSMIERLMDEYDTWLEVEGYGQ